MRRVMVYWVGYIGVPLFWKTTVYIEAQKGPHRSLHACLAKARV